MSVQTRCEQSTTVGNESARTECSRTRGPWEAYNNDGYSIWRIIAENGRHIAQVIGDDAETDANAAFIIRAVNSHDALVKALSDALAVIEDCVGYKHDGDPWTENSFDMGELDIHDYAKDGRLESARAALLLAKGTGR